MKHRGERSEGPYVFTELKQLQNSGKKDLRMCEATRKEARVPGNHCKDDLTKKPVCWAPLVLKGMYLATEREQTDGRLWLVHFREAEIDGVVRREVCADEMFQMLTNGLEAFSPAGLAASEWQALPGEDGFRQLLCDAGNVSPGRYNGSESQ